MRYIALLLLLFCQCYLNAQETYHRLKIELSSKQSLFTLARAGVDVSHGDYKAAKYFISDFSTQEQQKIEALGYKTEILIEDVSTFYAQQNDNPPTESRDNCNPEIGYDYVMPEHFYLGSMGGFYTYEELWQTIDSMILLYPDLVSDRDTIEGIQTYEGRPIYWLKISDNPNQDEEEPEVLYTALHHAREPNSLSQMLYFMWYLLENYNQSEEIQYLLQHTELYFIPCINPDGYIYNQTIRPNGGGLWRKNRRDNGDGTYGVDLNRNYGYEWGYNDQGSSPISGTDLYRGPSAFSEPETQAIRNFCSEHEFQIALNYHTFSDLLIYPWGYSDSTTPDHETFLTFSEALVRENNYKAGLGIETVGYTVNGDSDDWMYGDTTNKPPIFAFTPEVGAANFGFWPPEHKIVPNCQASLLQNFTAAHLVHTYALLNVVDAQNVTELDNTISYEIKRYGLKNGDFMVNLEPLSELITSVANPKTYTLDLSERITDTFAYTLSPNIQIGDTIRFNLVLDNGLLQQRTLVEKVYGSANFILKDDLTTAEAWKSTDAWDLTSEYFYSEPTSMTDSPNGNYASNTENQIVYTGILPTIEETEQALLTFKAKWDLEVGFDYAQVRILLNDVPVALCGQYTEEGTGEFQPLGQPLYNGTRNWVTETIDITEYLAFNDVFEVTFDFIVVSDAFIEQDGFYFDDISVVVNTLEGVTTTFDLPTESFKSKVVPNPTKLDAVLVTSSMFSNGQLVIFNSNGQQVAQQQVTNPNIKLEIVALPAGIYFYNLLSADGLNWHQGKFVIN